ncbi:MAG: hypothetical protein J1F04_09810 [Oscillospiraceae bacterium]|nr:hypothetical protein [Oscillospiraceae bacterium]
MNKTVKILLIALLPLVLAGATGFLILYINVNAIRFDYVDGGYNRVGKDDNIVTPFFGNKLMLNDGGGNIYGPPLGLGMKTIDVYMTVNDPISAYAFWMMRRYENGVQISYEVENDGKTLTVKLSGTGDNGEKTEQFEKLFIFDIEKASLKNLPTWTNRTEADNEFYSR